MKRVHESVPCRGHCKLEHVAGKQWGTGDQKTIPLKQKMPRPSRAAFLGARSRESLVRDAQSSFAPRGTDLSVRWSGCALAGGGIDKFPGYLGSGMQQRRESRWTSGTHGEAPKCSRRTSLYHSIHAEFKMCKTEYVFRAADLGNHAIPQGSVNTESVTGVGERCRGGRAFLCRRQPSSGPSLGCGRVGICNTDGLCSLHTGYKHSSLFISTNIYIYSIKTMVQTLCICKGAQLLPLLGQPLPFPGSSLGAGRRYAGSSLCVSDSAHGAGCALNNCSEDGMVPRTQHRGRGRQKVGSLGGTLPFPWPPQKQGAVPVLLEPTWTIFV